MRKSHAAVVVLCLGASTLGGCGIAAIVAAASYGSSVSAEDRKAFHAHNLEREKSGLAPLTMEEWRGRTASEKAEPPSDNSGMGS